MKTNHNLIQQFNPTTELITEEVNGKSFKYIQGIYLQSGIKNKNGNYYSPEVMQESVDRYRVEQIATNMAVGEFQHPDPPRPNIDLEKVCVRHIAIERQGNDWIGKSLILETEHGKKLSALLDGGIRVGTSSRALAKRVVHEGINQFAMGMKMCTIGDVVADPSAPKAFVDGVMEHAEWVWKDGAYIEDELEMAVEVVKKAKKNELASAYNILFQRLNKL